MKTGEYCLYLKIGSQCLSYKYIWRKKLKVSDLQNHTHTHYSCLKTYDLFTYLQLSQYALSILDV